MLSKSDARLNRKYRQGSRRCIPLRATSSHKAGTTSLHEGKALGVEQDVLAYVISRNILAVLLNRRYFVLLSNKALCVVGVIATMQLYFTVEEQLEILIRRPNTLCHGLGSLTNTGSTIATTLYYSPHTHI
jgi:hypothetical protein